jgi:hypothetical protein
MTSLNDAKSKALHFLLKFDKSNFPILLGLILLLYSMLLLITSPDSKLGLLNTESTNNLLNSSFANNVMTYAYLLFLAGLVWKFVLYLQTWRIDKGDS